jgi:hypothetical protein
MTPSSTGSSFVEPASGQVPAGELPAGESSTVEGATPIMAPSEDSSSTPGNSFITYPDGSEQTPIGHEALSKPTDPLKEDVSTSNDAQQPVDAIPETEEIDVLPEPESEEIVFPDEVDPSAELIDPELEPLPEGGF